MEQLKAGKGLSLANNVLINIVSPNNLKPSSELHLQNHYLSLKNRFASNDDNSITPSQFTNRTQLPNRLSQTNKELPLSVIKLTMEVTDENVVSNRELYELLVKKLTISAQNILADLSIANETSCLFLDCKNHLLTFSQQSIYLTQLELSLFKLLYNNPKRVYSRSQILEIAYHDNRNITDRAIDSHIKNIRKKIRSLGIKQTMIKTIYGVGYQYCSFEPSVS